MTEVFAQVGDLAIRPMLDVPADFETLVHWRNLPHVREWWDPDDPPFTLEAAYDKYRPRTDGTGPTTACIICRREEPVGYVQFYPWKSYAVEANAMGWQPEEGWWGLDVFIGEPGPIARGLGSRAVSLVFDYLAAERAATGLALIVDQRNLRAIRAYEKAGLTVEQTVLDTDTKAGNRVESWLMVRRPGLKSSGGQSSSRL